MLGIRRVFGVASALCALSTVVHAEDLYADFHVPEHRSFSCLLRSGGSGSWSNSNTGFGTSHASSGSGQLSSQLSWSSESEARLSDVRLETSVDGGQTRFRDRPFPTSEATRLQRQGDQRLALHGGERCYFGGSMLAVELSAGALLDFHQFVSSEARRDLNGTFEDFIGSENLAHFYGQQGTVSVSVGHGRVRDVSGVFATQLIEQRLLATGRLAHALSPGARLRLAQLHYIADDFVAAHDRPSRYFWREAERVLREDGALREGTLDAYTLERLLEPAFRSATFRRTTGCFVGPFWFGNETRGHRDAEIRLSRTVLDNGTLIFNDFSSSSQRTSLDEQQAGVGMSGEVHRPMGMRWQTDAFASTSYEVGPRRAWGAFASLQAEYMIADRWHASAQLRHQLRSRRLNGTRTEPAWRFDSAAGLSYLVEDSWSIDAEFFTIQSQSRDGDFSLSPSYQRASRLTFGLTYRPFGRFAAPGLGLSEHLATPTL